MKWIEECAMKFVRVLSSYRLALGIGFMMATGEARAEPMSLTCTQRRDPAIKENLRIDLDARTATWINTSGPIEIGKDTISFLGWQNIKGTLDRISGDFATTFTGSDGRGQFMQFNCQKSMRVFQ